MASKRKNKRITGQDQHDIEDIMRNEHLRSSIQQTRPLDKLRLDAIKPKSENQAKLVESINNNSYTICVGRPGTGKTLLSCAEALKLVQRKDTVYKKIMLCKSVIPLSNLESIGFLKGELDSKMAPVAESFMDNFYQIIGESETNKLVEDGTITMNPIAYLRGRSISKTIVIVDEVQNLTTETMHTIMTRLNHDSKMVLLGDIKQQDLKGKSGIETVFNKFINVDKFGIVRLDQDCDVQRSPLINIIERIFDEIEEERKNFKK